MLFGWAPGRRSLHVCVPDSPRSRHGCLTIEFPPPPPSSCCATHRQVRGGQAMQAEDPSSCSGVDLWLTDKPAYGLNGTFVRRRWEKNNAESSTLVYKVVFPLFLLFSFSSSFISISLFLSLAGTADICMPTMLWQRSGRTSQASRCFCLWHSRITMRPCRCPPST